MSSNGKVALVTGGSRGIGASIARRLAADGFGVVINYAGNAEAAEAVAAGISDAHGEAIVIQGDVSDAEAVKALFDGAAEAYGRIDVVVSNAGVMKLAPLVAATDSMIDETIATNLKGTLNVCREAARRLGDGGRIVSMSTSVIGVRLPGYAVYAATKAAVESLTQILAQEMRGRGVTVNAVAPGPTVTDLFLDGKSDELLERIAGMNPMERLGDPDDIARVVSFLAGPDGAWVNGQIIRVNGGMC